MRPFFTLVFFAFGAHLQAAPAIETAKPIAGAHGVELREFAKEPFLRNTVALTVDEQGHVYATSVVRRKAADLDIRQFRGWIESDLSLTSIADKRRFYRTELAPGGGKNYGRIGDQNKDGSIDWKDLTVLSDRIVRITDTDGDGVADEAVTFAEGFNTEVTGIAAGVTAWDGVVYATVEPDLWALRDENGDGRAEKRESLAHGFSVHIAYAGHNFSGPVVGPDGLYMSAADKGLNVTSREGVTYVHPHSGVIARCELDGSDFEVFAYGLRNVQEPAFDQFGNLFGVDNDGDMKGEKERFLYLTEGSDTGWRCNWQYRGKGYQPWLAEGLYVPEHPKQPAYITPCLSTYRDGPTGFAFNPGTALSPFYQDHFFMTAFPSRKLYAFKVQPKGPSFEMTGEHLVASGVLMTGLAFGPDGALYVADWSAKGYELNDKGGVWKLDDFEHADSDLRKTTASLLAADWTRPGPERLLELLSHDDQRVRMKAQFEIVRRKEGGLLMPVALDKQRPLLARLHAIWGLGQHLRLNGILWGDPYLMLYQDPDPEVRAQAAKTAGDSGKDRGIMAAPIRDLLKDPADRPRFFAAIALGRLRDREAFPALVDYLARDGKDPYHRHAGMMGILGCGTPAQLGALADHSSKPVRLAAIVALRRLATPEVAAFLDDADPLVVAEAARAIHDDNSIPLALPQLANLLESSPALEEATVRRALSAALRLRRPRHAGLVAAYAANDGHPEDLRLVALEILKEWPRPGNLDPVEGRYRPLATVEAAAVRPAVQEDLTTLMASGSKAIAEKARAAGAVYGIGTDPKTLLDLIRKDGEGAADSLRLLADRDKEAYAEAAKLAGKSRHPVVRAAALEASATLDPEALPSLAASALESGSLEEQRTALALLGKSNDKRADELLRRYFILLEANQLPPELALDLLEAAEASQFPLVKEQLARHRSARDASDPLSPYLETLAGGDPAKGRDIFNNHVAAQCVRCHQVEGGGSSVGPPLRGIGGKDPRYLLESLIVPGAAVAPGFGLVSVTTKSGEVIGGTLLEDGDGKMVIAVPSQEDPVHLSESDIASQTPPISSMPAMDGILDKAEIRDLLAFLQSLK